MDLYNVGFVRANPIQSGPRQRIEFVYTQILSTLAEKFPDRRKTNHTEYHVMFLSDFSSTDFYKLQLRARRTSMNVRPISAHRIPVSAKKFAFAQRRSSVKQLSCHQFVGVHVFVLIQKNWTAYNSVRSRNPPHQNHVTKNTTFAKKSPMLNVLSIENPAEDENRTMSCRCLSFTNMTRNEGAIST